MKNIFSFLTILAIISTLNYRAYAQVSGLGLVLDLKFNGNTSDSSPFLNHGISTGATFVAGRNGVPGTAVHLNGINQFITVPDHSSLDLDTALTLHAIFKFDSFYTGPCQANTILTKWNTNPSGYAILFTDNIVDNNCSTYDTSLYLFYGATSGNNWNQNLVNYQQYLHTNNWYCATFTQLNDTEKIYIDGILSAVIPVGDKHAHANTIPIEIGRGSNGSYSFAGAIDEVKIYSRALSDAEVAMLCSQQVTAIEEIETKDQKAVKTWYDPQNGYVYLHSTGLEQYNFEVFDMLGQRIRNGLMGGAMSNDVELVLQKGGVYLVRYNSGNHSGIQKVIIP